MTPYNNSRFAGTTLQIFIITVIYFVTAWLSLSLAYEHSNASPVWPPAGFAFAMMLLFGYRIAPGIFLGAFAANLLNFLSDNTCDFQTALLTSLFISAGNAGEAALGTYLLRKFVPAVKNHDLFVRSTSIFWFLYTAIVMCLVGCTVGATALMLGRIILREHYLTIGFTWWAGDVSGILLITPLILTWWQKPVKSLFIVGGKTRNRLEFFTIILAVVSASGVIFDEWFLTQQIFRYAFWVIPALVWAAVRLEQPVSTASVFLCSLIAVIGTLKGHGPFANLEILNQALISVEGFTCVIVTTTLLLNSTVRELRDAETKLRAAHSDLEVRIAERTSGLRQQKEFVETLFNSVEDMIAVLDREGNYISINRKTEKMYGRDRKDFIGKNAFDLFPAVKGTIMHDNFRRAVEGEVVHHLSYYSEAADKYFENFYIPLKDNSQQVYGVLVIGHDITDIKKSEELAKRSEEKFIKLFNSSPFGITLSEMSSGEIIEVNDNFLKMTGYGREEIIGHNSLEFGMMGASARKKIQDKLAEVGIIKNMEIEMTKKSGEKIWVMHSAESIEVGEEKYFLNAFNEITARKKAEEQLKESEERIQSIFRSAPDAVIVINAQGKIVGWNPQAETIFGWKAKEIIGKYVQDTIIPEHKEDMQQNELSRYLSSDANVNQTIEMPAVRKSGIEFFASISVSVTMIKGRKHFTAFVSDITEFRKAQEVVKQKSLELERSNRELEHFAYAASHDLQEPLRSVIAYLQIIEKRYKAKLDADGEEFIHRSIDSAVRMRTLINDLLSYSRAGTMDIEFNKVDSGFVAGVALDNLHKLIEENKGAVVFETPMPVVAASDLQLTLLFQNLISNGIKYKDGNPPQVAISAEDKNSYWQFSVKDNGMGIRSEDLERIFLIFQRLHTREEFSGTGIGLALCKKIVERHGGNIWVESEPGKGSTFYFTIPKRLEAKPA